MRNPKKLISISALKLDLIHNPAPTLIITAGGETMERGWQNPRLIPYTYLTPPKDGIYEFDFIGDAPLQDTPNMVTPMKVVYNWENIPGDLRGVIVYTSLNHLKRITIPVLRKVVYS